MAYTIDTSVWIAALLKDEPHNKQAYDFLIAVIEKGDGIIIPVTVYIEIAMALARRGENQLVDRVVEFLLKIPTLQFVELTYPRMIDVVTFATPLKLRGMDAVVVAVAHEYSSTLVTLDQELRHKAGSSVEVGEL